MPLRRHRNLSLLIACLCGDPPPEALQRAGTSAHKQWPFPVALDFVTRFWPLTSYEHMLIIRPKGASDGEAEKL